MDTKVHRFHVLNPLPRSCTLVSLALCLTAPQAAFAQTAAERAAAAQVLFDDALKLTNAGRYAEACPKFKSAQDLDPGMATQFRLADCYEHIGKTASAWRCTSRSLTPPRPRRTPSAKRSLASARPPLSLAWPE